MRKLLAPWIFTSHHIMVLYNLVGQSNFREIRNMGKFRFTVALVTVSSLLGIAIPCAAQQVLFANRSLKGNYAMDATGTYRSGALQLTMVGTGVLSSKGDGNVDATMTMMDASIVCNVTLNGSYTVQSNGLGTGTLTVSSSTPVNGVCDKFAGQQVSFAFVLEGKRPANKIKLSLTNSVFTLLGIGEPQS